MTPKSFTRWFMIVATSVLLLGSINCQPGSINTSSPCEDTLDHRFSGCFHHQEGHLMGRMDINIGECGNMLDGWGSGMSELALGDYWEFTGEITVEGSATLTVQSDDGDQQITAAFITAGDGEERLELTRPDFEPVNLIRFSESCDDD